ncbi:S9 family peptidase [Cellulophaga sp. HaHaR_3_176]|uniref:S9 family peptidase n=1 Tax=Cellulophaga sp. HaHaR_3_176 TaxID=1942464 RepID=UPI001C1F430B|nr:S9 family peptidase [Cellulophaga sp. HaHaR_3_176]QWX83151.1 S9 family peptidase [Cellulophaga sp. HaHaR_3_176]
MKKLTFLFLLVFSLTAITNAQKSKIKLEEIWGGTFRTERLDALKSLKNGTQYTVLNFDRATKTTSVDIYDYVSLEKVGTIVNSSNLKDVPYFSSYEFSIDESKVLLATEIESVFRHSTLGVFYIYDVKTKATIKISDNKIQEPTLSPDNSKVAYVFENNMYIFDIANKTTTKVTQDGVKNKIINGVTDWVYEEEFAFVRAFDWNSDGTKIAFLRFDETNVPEFSMDIYGQDLYQTQNVFKYPKAGEDNAIVSLHMLDVKSGAINNVNIEGAYYIPRIEWMNSKNTLSVQVLNRHQDNLKLYAVNAKKNSVSLLLEEKDAAYVDITDNLTFLEDDSFIWTSEKDGYNHIYLYNEDGELMNQITKGDWEVTNYYGYDQNEDKVYFQSTENGSINRDVYSIDTSGGSKKRLTSKDGQNNADFSADFTYFINTFSNAVTPPEYTLHTALTGEKVKEILNNEGLSKALESYEISAKEFSTISVNGNDLNMWMIKPANFDATKKYPLFMFQYSGPGSQSVSNTWMSANDYWYQLLASEGYIVACVDGRGTGFKGRDFKKVTQKELGKYEVEDQIAAAKQLSELAYVDDNRTGIWGWSYGGFMSTNCVLKGNDTFEMAIAVAPVTSWRFYDSIYTERYMQTPQENASGYDDNSPFNYPELLKGKYLLVHGTGDDNVHVQNSMRMVEALVQANKQFDWSIYPDKNHGIYGGNTRLHLYTKMTNFIKANL